MLTCKISAQKKYLNHTIATIPGDKSISHRAYILGALCDNNSAFSHILMSEDCLHTKAIMQALGVEIQQDGDVTMVQGLGLRGLKTPGEGEVLDVGNSGTGIRLLTGLLAAQSFATVITGDHSIQGRPMRRVVDPLTLMGAHISGQTRAASSDLFPPLQIHASNGINAINYDSKISSAQVKSSVLLAGLYADGLRYTEPEKSRDHTERLLQYFGAPITVDGLTVTLDGPSTLHNPDPETVLRVPADISSALFMIALALLLKKSKVTLTQIGHNKTRNAALACLKQMKGALQEGNLNERWEPTVDISVQSSKLYNIEYRGDVIPNVIDEIPILSILGLAAKGTMVVRDAEELRVKESDRISAIVRLVEAMGCEIHEFNDGFDLPGEQTIRSFTYDSGGDHRMAMSAIIAAISSGVDATVTNCDCIATSFPNFFDILRQLELSFELIES